MEIIKPSQLEIKSYLDLWGSAEEYIVQESSLKRLFTITYPLNNDLEEVLIKVCALNQFYSTQIRRILDLAKHIVGLNIDEDLLSNNLGLVEKIARGHKIRKSQKAKESYLYSFATKYCSHHKPNTYPIYDSYVEKMLLYFRDSDGFDNFKIEDLKSYKRFNEVLLSFRRYYNLESFNLKQIDKYLWQAGKEYFPKNYKKISK